MGRMQEARIEVQDSGSPLAGHSINQRKIKRGDEGQRRLQRLQNMPEVTNSSQIETDIFIPLSGDFIEQMAPFLIETALKRIDGEEQLPIPQRIVGSAQDVYRIYKEAKEKGLQGQMVDPPSSNILEFPVRRPVSHPNNLFISMFVARVKTLPWWSSIGQSSRILFTNPLPRSYIDNLYSTNFRVAGEEALVERVETYGYALAAISTALHTFADPGKAADIFFPMFLSVSQKTIR